MFQPEWENLASLLSLAVGSVAAVAAFVADAPLARPAAAARRAWDGLARRPAACGVLVPALSFALAAGVTAHDGVPVPVAHDEFSYLLAADTFAHGRVTNPPRPFPEHFETPHELVRPTYMSKYPPGQGLALAVGQVTTGRPIVGAWLSTAAAAGCIYWMLLAFASPGWALAGGIVAAVHPQLLDWSQTYWGGSLAVAGGAVLLGGWGRLMVRPTTSAAVALAVGLAVLANTRPYEGFVLAVPLVGSVLVRHGRRWASVDRVRVAAGIAAVLLPTAAAMGYYDHRVTGHVFRLPFMAYAAQYDVYPKLWPLPTVPVPVYHNAAMRWLHTNFERGLYDDLRTARGFCRISAARVAEVVDTCCKLAALFVPLAVAPFAPPDRRRRWVWVAVGVFGLSLLAENFVLPHYAAPVLPAVLLMTVVGWEHLSRWSPGGRPVGRALARGTAVGVLAGAAFSAAQPAFRDDLLVGQLDRRTAVAPLLRQGGRHLVFVEYAELHSPHVEWVQNPADPDRAAIVYARSLGPAADAPVIRYYPDRHPWLLRETGRLTLTPYPPVGGDAAAPPANAGR